MMRLVFCPLFLALTVVAAVRAQSISNFSALVPLTPGGTFTIGFVVPGSTPTTLLIRAVGGAALAQLGVSNPAAEPDFQLYNSKGQQFVFTSIPEAPQVNYPALYALVGAFPLTVGTATSLCGGYAPGPYTAVVSDDSGLGGTVLFEVYIVLAPVPMLPSQFPVTPIMISPGTITTTSN